MFKKKKKIQVQCHMKFSTNWIATTTVSCTALWGYFFSFSFMKKDDWTKNAAVMLHTSNPTLLTPSSAKPSIPTYQLNAPFFCVGARVGPGLCMSQVHSFAILIP